MRDDEDGPLVDDAVSLKPPREHKFSNSKELNQNSTRVQLLCIGAERKKQSSSWRTSFF